MKFVVLVCLLSFCSFLGATPVNMTSEPNVFKRISQTSWEQSNDIQFDSDVTLDTLEMIRKAGYPAEAHVIITEDGYILTLHRIPGGNGSLPVLLQHGLLCTSADWVILGKDKALAYLLADQGYDVWLGNYRGNTYSRKHVSLSPSELKFWNFSFHEMGIYDLPAMITFITNMTSQPLHTYIGHSMGTTGFYIMASERPEIAQMVQKMISLSPVAFTNHMESKIKYLIPLWRELKMIIRYFFHDEFLPQSDILKFLSKYLCEQNFEKNICVDLIFMICGYDREQFNYTLLPVILNHDPAGTSSKTLLHYVQIYQSAGNDKKSWLSCGSSRYDDGGRYLLTLYRIPAYLLADQGYDVWLGNFHGTTYSKAHISLSPSNPAFWDFSLDEIGIYDVSAMITFITNMRSQPLHTCVGHSMGTTCFYIMASERPEIARMVKMMINFGPAVFVNHMQSPIRFLIPIRRMIKMVMQLFFHGEYLQSDFVRFLLKNICDQNIAGKICYNIMSIIWGDDRE